MMLLLLLLLEQELLLQDVVLLLVGEVQLRVKVLVEMRALMLQSGVQSPLLVLVQWVLAGPCLR